ncbi:cation diffusion facilitator CzcD-associated flavoprotein CzcO [Spirosoma oryzae]|uniref:Cation diffusion facilitator CzcD-associated flavoprotein CzcO n=1 Tax=Spirosoma oryzae TaxID=1469603 RepID=A0A2T0SNN0_9BACT|nr:ArsO family NAD(P)H-dependent flavin-containing monooxygenase [Spirosoma oryzae]PRY35024.1 cation diffusion facilitator CzcD-associated flavoprotein CzcO [Spirosoma oryzae]
MISLSPKEVDIVVIGGGQSGLAVGYFLRRTGRSFVILDAGSAPGGSWNQGWDSLRLFSPAEASSLPGWPMPRPATDIGEFPSRQQVVDYLTQYESRYKLPIERPVRVRQVTVSGNGYAIETDRGSWQANAVVNTTGTASHPVVPPYPGQTDYTGVQLHSGSYRSPEDLAGQRVLIVGGGNSGAQILADVSRVAQTVWVTLNEPTFLPDDVDGRVLFSRATERYQTLQTGETPKPTGNLGDIVMVPTVRDARSRDVLHAVRPFERITRTGVQWADGRTEDVDTIIWCTGFRPATDYLRPLGIVDTQGRIATDGTKATQLPGLWLVGYGAWTGFASATLIGVGRSARTTADEVSTYLHQHTPAFTTHD